MIRLDSLIQIFMIEALLVLSLVRLIAIWRKHRHQQREHQAADYLIDRLKHAISRHSHELDAVLSDIRTLPEDRRKALVEEISQREKDLYRQILKLYLEHDITLLQQVDERVHAFTEPYQQLLHELPCAGKPEDAEKLRHAEGEIRHLKAEIERLTDQLQTALETIDSLSSEYTRMFAPDRTTEELEASRQRILETLKANERRFRVQADTPPSPITAEEGNDDIIITTTDNS